MEINSETFRKSETWAILTPIILLLIAVTMTMGMVDAQKQSVNNIRRAEGIVKDAAEIIKLRQQAAAQGLAEQKVRPFDTVNSALEAATAAGISDTKIYRGSSPTAKRLKDGSLQYRETYKINHVMMYQIASFIDYAERNYESLRCTDVSIVPSPDLKSKDSWDANINFLYIKK